MCLIRTAAQDVDSPHGVVEAVRDQQRAPRALNPEDSSTTNASDEEVHRAGCTHTCRTIPKACLPRIAAQRLQQRSVLIFRKRMEQGYRGLHHTASLARDS